MASPSNTTQIPAPTPPPRWLRGRTLIWLLGGIIALGALTTVTVYGGLLTARVAPGLSFRILEPASVSVGQTALIRWDVSTAGAQQFPTEKIELCRTRFFSPDCITLTPATPNDGEALVTIPATTPTGSAFLRLTAREGNGRLRTDRSSVKAIVVTGSTNVGPSNAKGVAVNTIQPAGPRSPIDRGTTQRVVLPNPGIDKKIELCRHGVIGDSCRTLAATASGSSATVTIPAGIAPGRAYLKVSERGTDGRLTGTVTYTRALLVTSGPPANQRTTAPVAGGDDGGGGGGSSDSGGSDEPARTAQEELEDNLRDLAASSGDPELDTIITPPQHTPTPTPDSHQVAGVHFLAPAHSTRITAGTPIDVQLQLIDTTRNRITCQEWRLDGELIMSSRWHEGQSPDLSAEPCTP